MYVIVSVLCCENKVCSFLTFLFLWYCHCHNFNNKEIENGRYIMSHFLQKNEKNVLKDGA